MNSSGHQSENELFRRTAQAVLHVRRRSIAPLKGSRHQRKCLHAQLAGAIAALGLLAGCAAPESSVHQETRTAETRKPLVKAAAFSFPQNHDWVSLFDGKTLTGWAITDFAGHGATRADDGKIILESGVMTGVTWSNDIPRMNFEVELEAMRVDGSDFFCGLTFPVGKDPCSLIVGGWGGGVVGISSLDGEDAANNETTKYLSFENGRWYKI